MTEASFTVYYRRATQLADAMKLCQDDPAALAELVLAPERFRVDPAKLKVIETRLLAKSRPYIEVRI
jgi:hypothetical protein